MPLAHMKRSKNDAMDAEAICEAVKRLIQIHDVPNGRCGPA